MHVLRTFAQYCIVSKKKLFQPWHLKWSRERSDKGTGLLRHLPSLSISNTLMASSVLRERNSLAGSVWRRCLAGDTDAWRGLKKGSALTVDMLVTWLSSKPTYLPTYKLLMCIEWCRVSYCTDSRSAWPSRAPRVWRVSCGAARESAFIASAA